MSEEQIRNDESSTEDDQFTIDDLDGGDGAEQEEAKTDDPLNDTAVEIEESEEKVEEKREDIQKKKLREVLNEKELFAVKKVLKEKTQVLEEKSKLLAEYEDLLKRKQAEFENYRKRILRETEDNKKYATAEIVLDILNIIDDLERAIKSAESSQDFDALLEGITIVERQLSSVLEKKYGVTRIESVGKPFDPTVHDAITMMESDQHREDTVIEDFQKGYRMHERVIRHSKVKVAKAVSSDEAQHANNEGEDPEKGE